MSTSSVWGEASETCLFSMKRGKVLVADCLIWRLVHFYSNLGASLPSQMHQVSTSGTRESNQGSCP